MEDRAEPNLNCASVLSKMVISQSQLHFIWTSIIIWRLTVSW